MIAPILIRWQAMRPVIGLTDASDNDHRSGFEAPYGETREWLRTQGVRTNRERVTHGKAGGVRWRVYDYNATLTQAQAVAFKVRFGILPWR